MTTGHAAQPPQLRPPAVDPSELVDTGEWLSPEPAVPWYSLSVHCSANTLAPPHPPHMQVSAASCALQALSPVSSANVTCCGKEPDSDRIVWSRYKRAGEQAHYHAPCVIPLFTFMTWHGARGRHHCVPGPPPWASLCVRPPPFAPPPCVMQVLPGGCHGRQLHRPLVQNLARL